MTSEIEIVRVGPLTEGAWDGSISLKDRLASGELSSSQIDFAVGILTSHAGGKITEEEAVVYKEKYGLENINSTTGPLFVKTSHTARSRCVDGRCILHYNERDSEMADRELGPMIAAGTAGAGLTFRMTLQALGGELLSKGKKLVGVDEKPLVAARGEANLGKDIGAITEIFEENELKVGGHGDTHAAESKEKTGCGAIDNMELIVATMAKAGRIEELQNLTKAMLREKYSEKAFNALVTQALYMASQDEYFENKSEALVELMKHDKDSVSELDGDHKEALVIVNYVTDTTFHRDRFSHVQGDEVGAFNYDIWRTFEVAKVLTSDKVIPDLDDNEREYAEALFYTARTMFTVGTLMVLTDGSLELVVRK